MRFSCSRRWQSNGLHAKPSELLSPHKAHRPPLRRRASRRKSVNQVSVSRPWPAGPSPHNISHSGRKTEVLADDFGQLLWLISHNTELYAGRRGGRAFGQTFGCCWKIEEGAAYRSRNSAVTASKTRSVRSIPKAALSSVVVLDGSRSSSSGRSGSPRAANISFIAPARSGAESTSVHQGQRGIGVESWHSRKEKPHPCGVGVLFLCYD